MTDFRAWLTEAGLSQSECARRFGIPLRTVQGWALGERKCPDYLLRLMKETLIERMYTHDV